MKPKHFLAGLAALMANTAAMAGALTGNVGVVSDYLFRGIDQSSVGVTQGGGAAVQGGVDYNFDLGAYTGLWVTNNSVGGGNEARVYAGYGANFGLFTLDTGVIYYAYTEDTESLTNPGLSRNTDYAEVYLGGGVGPLNLKMFYTNAFGSDLNGSVSGDPGKNSLLYTSASATLNLTDTISFTPQVGFTSGDGAKDAFGDEYTDYSLTAAKLLKDDFSVSLAVVGTDLKNFNGIPDNRDAPKFVIGFKKDFKI